jgi:hypothetical protein
VDNKAAYLVTRTLDIGQKIMQGRGGA